MNHAPIRVLHVDDEPDFADLTATMLEREDDRFAVETATSAAEGLESVTRHPPDCVISDYEMPGRNGIEFLRSVREDWPDLPFLLFTGKGSEEVASEAISAGVTDYLQKGSGTDRYELLANRITNAVEARQSAEQLSRQEELVRLTETTADTGGWELDLETDRLEITAGAGRLTGLSPNTRHPLERVLALVRSDDRPEARATVDRAIQHREQVQATWEIQPANEGRDRRVLDVTITPVVSGSEVTALRGAISDVSERVNRQQQLAQARERMEYALRTTNSEIFELDPETDEQTRYGPFEQLYGLPSEAVGTTERFLAEAVHPADRERFEQLITDAIDRAPTTVEAEYRTNPTNGSLRWLRTRLSGRTDETGEVRKVVGLTTDITARKRRERRLRQYQTLLEHIDDAVFVIDSDRTVAYANEQSMANINGKPEEIVGKRIVPMVSQFVTDEAQVEAFDTALETAFAGRDEEQPDSVELTVTVDGARSVFEYEFSRIPAEDAATGESKPELFVAVVAREVTERTERIAELRRTKGIMAEMERIADIGAWEYDPETGAVTNTTGARRIYGLDPDEEVTLEDALEFYHPADRRRLMDLFQDCVASGESYETDAQLTTADDETRWVTARGERVEARDGRPVVRGYIQDITTETEQVVRLEQIETLFENAQDLLFIIEHTDDEFVIQRVNRAFERATGLSDEQLRGKTPQEVFGTERGQEIEQQYRRCLGTGEPQKYEEAIAAAKLPGKDLSDDDEPTYWETKIAPVETEDNRQWIVGATRDINERKRRRQELERQNERLSEFASVVSHDLRNPLQVATGRLELAQTECDSAHLDDVAGAIDQCQTLIDDLLTLARAGDGVGSPEPVSLPALARECWEVTPDETATLTVATGQTVLADRNRLRQLLENLLTNAVEHGGADTTVRVGTLPDGFYVADDGGGIPDGERERIFEAGYSTAEDGTGFGLRIVKQVADDHGWGIRVTDGDDGGARFEVTGIELPEENNAPHVNGSS